MQILGGPERWSSRWILHFWRSCGKTNIGRRSAIISLEKHFLVNFSSEAGGGLDGEKGAVQMLRTRVGSCFQVWRRPERWLAPREVVVIESMSFCKSLLFIGQLSSTEDHGAVVIKMMMTTTLFTWFWGSFSVCEAIADPSLCIWFSLTHWCFSAPASAGKASRGAGATHARIFPVSLQQILRHSRENATKVIFLITDGYSNGGDPRPVAASLRDFGVEIFTFGIWQGNIRELNDMASAPKDEHCYLLHSFEEFEALARRALHEGNGS